MTPPDECLNSTSLAGTLMGARKPLTGHVRLQGSPKIGYSVHPISSRNLCWHPPDIMAALLPDVGPGRFVCFDLLVDQVTTVGVSHDRADSCFSVLPQGLTSKGPGPWSE